MRSEQDLDRVRDEWVDRYNARLRALNMLGLSVGTPKEDVAERYEILRARLAMQPDDAATIEALDDAYALLSRDQ
jgi:hypothetical protein